MRGPGAGKRDERLGDTSLPGTAFLDIYNITNKRIYARGPAAAVDATTRGPACQSKTHLP